MFKHCLWFAAFVALSLACSSSGPNESSYFDVARVQTALDRILPIGRDSLISGFAILSPEMRDVMAAGPLSSYGVLPDGVVGKRFELDANGATYVEATIPSSDPGSVEFVVYACDSSTYQPLLPLQPLGLYRIRNGDPMPITLERGVDTVISAIASFGRSEFVPAIVMTGALTRVEDTLVRMSRSDQPFGSSRSQREVFLGLPDSVVMEVSESHGEAFDQRSRTLIIGRDTLVESSSSTIGFQTFTDVNGKRLMIDFQPAPGIELNNAELRALRDARSTPELTRPTLLPVMPLSTERGSI